MLPMALLSLSSSSRRISTRTLEHHIVHFLTLVGHTQLFIRFLLEYCLNNVLGMLLTVFGQVLRSTAMIHAASNFSHQIVTRKEEDHALVTEGIYGLVSPSYAQVYP
jgi:protein-S-isoprenylcysteine O-methyltransferase